MTLFMAINKDYKLKNKIMRIVFNNFFHWNFTKEFNRTNFRYLYLKIT